MTDPADEYDRYHAGPDFDDDQPSLASIFHEHLFWGWVAILEDEYGGGPEAIFGTEAKAMTYKAAHLDPESVEIFPMIFLRGDPMENNGRRLTPEEIAVLGPCPNLPETADD